MELRQTIKEHDRSNVSSSLPVEYSAASINPTQALPVTFYTTFDAGDPQETGKPYNIGYDAQAVHGIEHETGLLVSVGHSWESETGSSDSGPRSAFIVAGQSNGQYAWHYLSNIPQVDEGVVAVTQMHPEDGGDILAAGFYRAVGGRYQKWLIRVNAGNNVANRLVWAKAFNESSNNTHATFESISIDDDGVVLGGVQDNSDGSEFKFKSAGNVPAGNAFVMRVQLAGLHRSGGPLDSDVSFLWVNEAWTSVKSLRTADKSGNIVALVHREVNSQMEAGLVLLHHATGTPIWGPFFYSAQTEGTDVAVAPDNSGFVITGHGNLNGPTSAKAYYGRLTRVNATGGYLWTATIASNPAADVIYNECWGVQPYGWHQGSDGWILSCGTGIEGTSTCSDSGLNVSQRAWCAAGAPSAWGGVARMPSVWSNMVVAFADSVEPGVQGALKWSRVNSYTSGEAGYVSGSSAAEFISPCSSGGFYVTTDENLGIGLLRLGGPTINRTS